MEEFYSLDIIDHNDLIEISLLGGFFSQDVFFCFGKLTYSNIFFLKSQHVLLFTSNYKLCKGM